MTTSSTTTPDADRLLADALHRVWGFSAFRPLQREAMHAILESRDSIVVLPTGGGKSLCFQAPAIVDPRGLALVVSPLISLMKDQVDGLRVDGVAASYLNSTLLPHERDEVLASVRDGRCRLLYVSPERIAGEGSQTLRRMLQQAQLRFIAIDEAHCISQWGHDFRPEYRQLGRLREDFPGVSFHAFTATATERVRRDILTELRLQDAAGAGRLVRSAEPRLPRASAGQPAQPAAGHPRPARRRIGHRLLLVAQGNGSARRMAEGRGAQRGAVSRRPVRRGPEPPSGDVPRRARRHRRRDGGVRDGHRPIERALRRARGRAAIAGALPAGIRPRGPRRPAGGVRADLLGQRLRPLAADARGQRRVERERPVAAARHGALRRGHALPAPLAGGVLRPAVRACGLRRVRLVPERAGRGRRLADPRPEDPVVRRARQADVGHRARHRRPDRQGDREGRRRQASRSVHVRAAEGGSAGRHPRLHRAAGRRRPARARRRSVSGAAPDDGGRVAAARRRGIASSIARSSRPRRGSEAARGCATRSR